MENINLKAAYIEFQGKRESVPLSHIFQESVVLSNLTGIKPKDFHLADLGKFDVLVLPYSIIGSMDLIGDKARKVKKFVRSGGICWIMHQTIPGWFSPLFPKSLKPIEILNRYEDLPDIVFSSEHAKEYVCPWIFERNHPIWNKPNYVDESDFLSWKVEAAGRIFETSAAQVIFVPQDWRILAGFADYVVKLKDRAAIVCEAGYGKGMYFWTQVLPPEFIWSKDTLEKTTWRRLLENILTYFRDLKAGHIFKTEISPEPWALKHNERIKINIKSDKKIDSMKWQITHPDEKIDTLQTEKGLVYTPKKGGTYKVRAIVETGERGPSAVHTFFKTTKDFTPFKFLTHVHFEAYSVPESFSTIFGNCRKLNIDGAFLAGGLFCGDKDRYLKVEEEKLKLIDNPAVRFFPGEEVHFMRQYKEGAIEPDKYDTRRHAVALGCANLHPYGHEYWEPDILAKIHRKKGLAIAAHPNVQRWWMSSQNGHNFEGFEWDDGVQNNWDELLEKGKFVVGMIGMDNLGKDRLCLSRANIAWFDEPFTKKNLLNTILKGRITYIPSYNGEDNSLWFDINGQVVGGTIYVTDRVELNIRAKCNPLIDFLVIVKDGKRLIRKVNSDRKRCLSFSWSEQVKRDCYYRVEAGNTKLGIIGFTNPIFVKRVNGPKDGYFYFQNFAPYFFDKKEGRYRANLTEVKRVRLRKDFWQIDFGEPGKGSLFIGGVGVERIIIDKEESPFEKTISDKIQVEFGPGMHSLNASTKR